MMINRRDIGRGLAASAATLALKPSALLAAAAPKPAPASFDQAVAAIDAYAADHLRVFNLPGMTLGLALPGGGRHVRHFGFAELGAKTPITDTTLFQIGSISKLLTAALLHQFASEGRLRLTDSVMTLLPALDLPAGDGITVQQLLDHVAGLPADAPLFPDGGLWTGFKPGTHWSYSNTGYDALGKLAEHLGGKPLDRLLRDHLFAPLGMANTFGAITSDQRTRYAQGYEAADNVAPFTRGTALAPAAWVDVTFAAGSTASTASDMVLLMRSIASAAAARGGLGLSPSAGLQYARHAVATGAPNLRYGNGLMHVPGTGGRDLIHHTGGMVSFSSSFHVDPLTGAGAFASSTISAFAAYRPRLLTQFAVSALAAVREGRALPAPTPLIFPVADASDYAGRYAGPEGNFEIVAAGNSLSIVANGQRFGLEQAAGDLFHTLHPRFRNFALMAERGSDKKVGGMSWGSSSFIKDGSAWRPSPSDPKLAMLAGRYVDDSPWFGAAVIVERGGQLWFGTETPLIAMSGDLFRIGEESWSPERARFLNPIDGRPQTLVFSGEKFVRHDI